MTDLEISKALALAIGWTESRVDKDGQPDPDVVTFAFNDPRSNAVKCWDGDDWRVFDYRDWNVISPIAERYDCFPLLSDNQPGKWFTRPRIYKYSGNFIHAETPQKAIAMAVIAGAKP